MSLESAEQKASDYESKVLPQHGAPGILQEYEQYLKHTPSELKALSALDCTIICTRLVQYATYVKRCYNRDASRVKHLKKEIQKKIAAKVHEFPGRWEFQERQAIANDLQATILDNQLSAIEERMERLKDMGKSLETLADQYKSLQFSKRDKN